MVDCNYICCLERKTNFLLLEVRSIICGKKKNYYEEVILISNDHLYYIFSSNLYVRIGRQWCENVQL